MSVGRIIVAWPGPSDSTRIQPFVDKSREAKNQGPRRTQDDGYETRQEDRK